MASWKSLQTKLRTLRRLSGADHAALLQAGVLLPLTVLAFRGLGFRRWQATLQRWSPRSIAPDGGTERAYRVAWLVRVAARFVAPRDSCLSQSLVLWWLLRRRGLTSELRIGVRKCDGRLQAHAWVQYRDLALNGRGDPVVPFIPFDRAIVPLASATA
jgi:hypothetical protein